MVLPCYITVLSWFDNLTEVNKITRLVNDFDN